MSALLPLTHDLLSQTVDGVIFSGPLIPPVLDGTKTVTRRMSKRWLKRKKGDLLFVRETLRMLPDFSWSYGADGKLIQLERGDPRVPAMVAWAHHNERTVCVSIHMPRWASRCVLRLIEDPRSEPLRAITEDDARREGVEPIHAENDIALAGDDRAPYRRGFKAKWCDLHHGKKGECWGDNPTVVRLAFERVA